MNLLLWAKHNLKNIPPSVGRYLSMVPYNKRPGIGPSYRARQKDIECYALLDPKTRQHFIFERMKQVLEYSVNNIPFYQKFYSDKGFQPTTLRHFESLQEIPVMSKTDLNQIELEYRSAIQSDRYITNTGGSSGVPLNFFIQSSFMGTEWAHMHRIWQQYGFRVSDFKLLFIGVGTKDGKAITYDFVRNSFMVNIYAQPEKVISELKYIVKNYSIRFLHGYPSALYFFAIQIESLAPDLRTILSNSVKGVFLNSEFPQPHFRNTIEKVFSVPTLSWYGHTERCVLAHEKDEKFLFYPMQTYGWVEAVQNSNGKSKLIGSSYYNLASPFIRYDTGDLIENCKFDSAGILNSFNIYDGRNGEFILDKYLNQISLTGLIFGRHHLLFDYTTCVQVKQEVPGFATILYVRSEGRLFPYNGPFSELFDTSNINVKFDFQEILKPILTNSGKLNLLIK